MNVLLLYPAFPDTFWSYTHALWFVGKKAVLPPLGLLTVAAMLPETWNKRLVDLNVTSLRDPDLQWANMVFISAMGVQRAAALELIRRCKSAGKTIVVGGPLFTAEEAFFDEVDHFVLNEAEITLPPFLADLQSGTPQRIYRSDQFAPLASSPIPQWNLVDSRQYNSMGVQYSRGCPFACDFCSVTAMLGRTPRGKSSQQVLAELDALQSSGWRGPVFIVDDNLIGMRKQVTDDLLPAMARWQKAHGPVPLQTQVSIDLADDPHLVQLMCDAGFDTVFIGIETPDEASLSECGKRQNTHRDLAQSVKTLQNAGIEVQGGFIVGFDNDTPAVFQRQIDFIQRTGIVTAMVGLLQALSGTRLYDRLRQENRLRCDSTGDNADGTTNILPTMGLDPLRQGYARLLNGIYSPHAYYQRVRTFLREYHMPPIKTRLDLTQVHAFVRSLFHLGIAGRERWQYWFLLGWTLTHRPRLFPKAVRLAICGHHYISISRQYTYHFDI